MNNNIEMSILNSIQDFFNILYSFNYGLIITNMYSQNKDVMYCSDSYEFEGLTFCLL